MRNTFKNLVATSAVAATFFHSADAQTKAAISWKSLPEIPESTYSWADLQEISTQKISWHDLQKPKNLSGIAAGVPDASITLANTRVIVAPYGSIFSLTNTAGQGCLTGPAIPTVGNLITIVDLQECLEEHETQNIVIVFKQDTNNLENTPTTALITFEQNSDGKIKCQYKELSLDDSAPQNAGTIKKTAFTPAPKP